MLDEPKLPGWLGHLVASLGGAGIFVVSLLDSSFLSFPFVTDLLVIEFSIHKREYMLYYVGMAALGSLAGCVWLYLVAKKGGESYYRKREGAPPGRIRRWVSRHGFLSVFAPALFPPPMPFKAFVLAEGVFQVPFETFVLGIVSGRGIRYLLEGIFAVSLGAAAERFMLENKALLVVLPLVMIGIAFLASRWLFRAAPEAKEP